MLLAIDPGNVMSAYVMVEENTYRPITFGKVENEKLLSLVKEYTNPQTPAIIEMVASYGMAVGKDVFDTCVWIGRYTQAAIDAGACVDNIYRSEEKMNLCHRQNARDSNIRQALVDRFSTHDFKSGKGTKKNPDFFYGFANDVWAAYAVAVTYIDKRKMEG